MFIEKIRLENFRNLTGQELEFSDGVNILTGINAQGKTNVIEAVWIFSACKSFRTNNDKEFIQHNCNFATVDVLFNKDGRNQSAALKYYERRRREIYLNEVKVKPSEMIGNFLSVLFFPEHLNLIKEGPDVRRKFLDFAICQVKPVYFSLLTEYNKVLFQRNNALKSEDPGMFETIDIWDQKLAKTGAAIYIARKNYIKELARYAAFIIDEMTNGKEFLKLEYKSFCYDNENISIIEQELLNKLVQSRNKDIRFGYTTQGIHKDDLEIILNDRSAKSFGSQGQQRSAVMGLKLAEAEILKNTYGEYPVLLFDDVFSELDSNRKNYIVEKIKNKQVIITSCENPEEFRAARLFEIKNGQVDLL